MGHCTKSIHSVAENSHVRNIILLSSKLSDRVPYIFHCFKPEIRARDIYAQNIHSVSIIGTNC